jgi:hypothetical protein
MSFIGYKDFSFLLYVTYIRAISRTARRINLFEKNKISSLCAIIRENLVNNQTLAIARKMPIF